MGLISFREMHFRLLFTCLIFYQIQQISFAQDNSPLFYEIIKSDSVKMFFNEQNKFTDKKCSDFIRYTKVDRQANFNGYYEDLSNEGTLKSKGNYIHGKKHGYFEIYYPSGTITCRGTYKNNVPTGTWEYFYENGLPERTIVITDSDTLLMSYSNNKGIRQITEGNGEFKGLVEGNSVIAKGKIKNGKPDGKWTSTLTNKTVYCDEEFENGQLIRGIFPNARLGGNEEYTHRSYLNSFFLISYLNTLEDFLMVVCADSSVSVSEKRSSNFHGFKSDLKAKIDNVVDGDFGRGNTGDYSIGDHKLTIQFSVNGDGRAENFILLTGWGQKFFNAISSSLYRHITFPNAEKIMFFHLTMHFAGGPTYSYSFEFSKERTVH